MYELRNYFFLSCVSCSFGVKYLDGVKHWKSVLSTSLSVSTLHFNIGLLDLFSFFPGICTVRTKLNLSKNVICGLSACLTDHGLLIALECSAEPLDCRWPCVRIYINLSIHNGNRWPIDETKFCDLLDWSIDEQLRIIDWHWLSSIEINFKFFFYFTQSQVFLIFLRATSLWNSIVAITPENSKTTLI